MKDRAVVVTNRADYQPGELGTIMSAMMGGEPHDVCSVAAVVVVHHPAGGHELRVLADNVFGAPNIAALLRHAADHCHGGCRRCARNGRKRGNHATG